MNYLNLLINIVNHDHESLYFQLAIRAISSYLSKV